jgi:hypothetical protein
MDYKLEKKKNYRVVSCVTCEGIKKKKKKFLSDLPQELCFRFQYHNEIENFRTGEEI